MFETAFCYAKTDHDVALCCFSHHRSLTVSNPRAIKKHESIDCDKFLTHLYILNLDVTSQTTK